MKKLVIEKRAVKKNVEIVKERVSGAAIYAALPADAYGAGLTEMASLLRAEGIGRFAVSESAQAAALRDAGFVDEEILMLRSTTDRQELERLIDLGIVCTIGSYDTGVALNALAEARATVVEAHLQVDIGMGLGGLLMAEPDKILSLYQYLPNVALSGIYTQISDSRAGRRVLQARMDEFRALLEAIHKAGFETGTVHVSCPFPLMRAALGSQEGVRIGVQVGETFLGRGPRKKDDGLVKVGYGEAPLCEVRWLSKGHRVGGPSPVTLRRPTRVATLPVGYQNGFGVARNGEDTLWSVLRRRWLSRRIRVRIGGQPVRVIGGIGPFETALDVTHVKCAVGDMAVFEVDPLYARELSREYR